MAQSINLGPYTGDSLQQMSTRQAHVQQLSSAGAQFHKSAAVAQQVADSQGMVVYYLPGASGGHGGSDKPIYAVAPVGAIQAGGQGGSGGGGTSSTGGGGGAGSAAPAVQAGLPAYTGGGPSFSIGAVNQNLILQQRDDEFEGVDAFTPAEKLSPGYSPDATNWDGFAKIGSRCVRRGCAKLEDDHDSLSLHADLRGLSLAVIPNGQADQLQLLYAFADNDIGQTRSAQATSLQLITTSPRWGRPVTLKGWDGPNMDLTDNGSQELQIDADYANIFNASTQLGQRANSVVALTIRYSTSGYPRDIDGFDYVNSTAVSGADRVAWKGEDKTITQTLTATTYYLTAWGITREGISEPSYASITLA